MPVVGKPTPDRKGADVFTGTVVSAFCWSRRRSRVVGFPGMIISVWGDP